MNIDYDVLNGIWAKLCQVANSSPIDVITVRLDGRQGKCFLASCDGNVITVQNSTTRNPSVELSQERRFDKEEFISIGQYYDGWRSGSIARPFIRDKSENSSYIFGIISKFKTSIGIKNGIVK
jgi:hypothetical protein